MLSLAAPALAEPQTEAFLLQAMRLQASQRLTPTRTDKEGFVITVWSGDEWRELIGRGGTLHLAVDSRNELLGYALFSPYSAFRSILLESDAKLSFDVPPADEPDWSYLYQLAVASEAQRKGVATTLAREGMRKSGAKHLIADFMIRPRNNLASAKLFKKLGFENAGTLAIEAYRNFEPSLWQVVKSN